MANKPGQGRKPKPNGRRKIVQSTLDPGLYREIMAQKPDRITTSAWFAALIASGWYARKNIVE